MISTIYAFALIPLPFGSGEDKTIGQAMREALDAVPEFHVMFNDEAERVEQVDRRSLLDPPMYPNTLPFSTPELMLHVPVDAEEIRARSDEWLSGLAITINHADFHFTVYQPPWGSKHFGRELNLLFVLRDHEADGLRNRMDEMDRVAAVLAARVGDAEEAAQVLESAYERIEGMSDLPRIRRVLDADGEHLARASDPVEAAIEAIFIFLRRSMFPTGVGPDNPEWFDWKVLECDLDGYLLYLMPVRITTRAGDSKYYLYHGAAYNENGETAIEVTLRLPVSDRIPARNPGELVLELIERHDDVD